MRDTAWWNIDPATLPEESPLRVYLEHLGRAPCARPDRLDLSIEVQERLERYTRQRVSYLAEPDGARIPAYLLVPHEPRDAPRSPAIVALHQHNLQFHLGKSEVVGLAGNVAQQSYAHELAERGFIVIAPDAPAFEERVSPGTEGRASEDAWAASEMRRGWCLAAKAIWDIGRAIDVLESLAHVDANRIGVIGHSMGGWMTIYAMAVESRLKVGVSNCGFADVSSVGRWFRRRGPDAADQESTNDYAQTTSGLDRVALVGGLICPRPLLVISPNADAGRNRPADEVSDAGTIRHAYGSRRVRDRFDYIVPACAHRFPDESRALAYAWLERWLAELAPGTEMPPIDQLQGRPLGRVLQKMRKVTREQYTEGLTLQKRDRRALGQILIGLGYINENDLNVALAAQHGYEFVSLDGYNITPQAIAAVPVQIALTNKILPLEFNPVTKTVVVAMASHENFRALNDLRSLMGYNVIAKIAYADQIDQLINKFYKDDIDRLGDIIGGL